MILSELKGKERVKQIKIERLKDFINLVGRNNLVNMDPVIRQLAELSGVAE